MYRRVLFYKLNKSLGGCLLSSPYVVQVDVGAALLVIVLPSMSLPSLASLSLCCLFKYPTCCRVYL